MAVISFIESDPGRIFMDKVNILAQNSTLFWAPVKVANVRIG
jgi:hypothetical protein